VHTGGWTTRRSEPELSPQQGQVGRGGGRGGGVGFFGKTRGDQQEDTFDKTRKKKKKCRFVGGKVLNITEGNFRGSLNAFASPKRAPAATSISKNQTD